MKKRLRMVAVFLTALFLAVAMLAGCAGTPDPDSLPPPDPPASEDPADTVSGMEEFKVLAIGNSYTQDTMRYLYKISQLLGAEKTVLGNMYISGAAFRRHVDNARNDAADYSYEKNTTGSFIATRPASLDTALRDEDWDYVVFHQASHYANVAAIIDEDLDYFMAYVRERTGEKTKLAWNLTWSGENKPTPSDEQILSVVQTQIMTRDFVVIPTGTTIQLLRQTEIRVDAKGYKLTRDGTHLNDCGKFAAGMTWAKVLGGYDTDSIAWVPGTQYVNLQELDLIKQCINQATALFS